MTNAMGAIAKRRPWQKDALEERMCVYYELIVFLYVGANTFWMFDFSEILQYPKLLFLRVLLFWGVF